MLCGQRRQHNPNVLTPSASTPLALITLLCCRLQASPAELQAALAEQRAVQVGRHWRLVEEGYLGGLLELLLLR